MPSSRAQTDMNSVAFPEKPAQRARSGICFFHTRMQYPCSGSARLGKQATVVSAKATKTIARGMMSMLKRSSALGVAALQR
jgi:hypothetical protein